MKTQKMKQFKQDNVTEGLEFEGCREQQVRFNNEVLESSFSRSKQPPFQKMPINQQFPRENIIAQFHVCHAEASWGIKDV